MRFDVVIPTYNDLPHLKQCLTALETQSLRDFRVLVCVDGSTDGTFDYLETATFGFPIVVLAHPGRDHRGLGATRNLALPVVEAPFVLLLDADMWLCPSALMEHRGLLEERRCASVGSISYLNTGSNLWTKYISSRRLGRWPDRTRIPFNLFTAANAAVRTADFFALGGFDEEVVGYGGEEFDFAYRLQLHRGTSMIFNRPACATSVELKTLDEAVRQMRTLGRNVRLLRQKHPTMPHFLLTDRIESRSLKDRALRMLMNPLTDRVVDLALPISPFAVQHQLINYKVIRAVWKGYAAAGSRH